RNQLSQVLEYFVQRQFAILAPRAPRRARTGGRDRLESHGGQADRAAPVPCVGQEEESPFVHAAEGRALGGYGVHGYLAGVLVGVGLASVARRAHRAAVAARCAPDVEARPGWTGGPGLP